MNLTRRAALTGAAAALAAPAITGRAFAAEPGAALPIPPLAETGATPTTLEAIAGRSRFLDGVETQSVGYSQPYLGPTLRMTRGASARMNVVNRLGVPVTSHWHGMHVDAKMDGGPQLAIAPGATWEIDMPIVQPAATLWYHSHIHGQTGRQVYAGLAGMLIVDDPEAGDEGLPADYGVDDLPLAIQDRAFTSAGAFAYAHGGPDVMMGFRADTILVNGAVRPRATPPAGLVRLRILNASNARIYHLRFSDGRGFHQVASDGGLLPAPLAMNRITLAPAERAEIVVDFSSGAEVSLLSGPDGNTPMGGMMRMMMGGGGDAPPASPLGDGEEFEVMSFAPGPARAGAPARLPASFASAPGPVEAEAVRRREFTLNMHAGGGGMGGMMGGGMRGMGAMGINGAGFDMGRIDVALNRGEAEIWSIRAEAMAHPFHVHGTSFSVISNGGRLIDHAKTGLKDVVLVDGRADILVKVDHTATNDVPFMLHCHILEHEDAGMMHQFTVT